MINNQTNMNFRAPVIDVCATSKNLKSLREGRGISVSEIQKMFGMENPQSVYNWENPEKKYLPCLDNLVFLAKIYKVSLDD
ncbi:MAG: helix-turn-helix transcriptional regulator, partial [Treponema sp.]|nr:helix-turn-helix transcriptional regulator [Treponema sp.]